jgi:hypothetical protein
MAGRGGTTFQKRQKEQLRLERRQQKAAKKIERKAAPKDDSLGESEVQPQEPTPDAQ